MIEYISIKHSFNAGDAIVILPGLRQLYRDTGKKVKIFQRIGLPAHYYNNQINSTVDDNGESVCMNLRVFNMLKPLLEAQEYIESFEVWEGQEVQLDYDLTRDSKSIPMPAGLLHTYSEAIFPQTSTDLSEKWLNCSPKIMFDLSDIPKFTIKEITQIYEQTGKLYYRGHSAKVNYSDKVIINRTQRYNNPYITFHFLKTYESQLLFSGTVDEHNYFCDKNKLDIELLNVTDFLQLANIISDCKFGVYNQSLNWHIADALKTRRILEVCAAFPNTFATGYGGYHAFGQAAMEFYFNKLINQ